MASHYFDVFHTASPTPLRQPRAQSPGPSVTTALEERPDTRAGGDGDDVAAGGPLVGVGVDGALAPTRIAWPVALTGRFSSVDSAGLAGFGRPGRRSFLAQPEPLKWTVGGLNALLRVPWAPQAGQAPGPLPLIEWTISVVLPQLEQM